MADEWKAGDFTVQTPIGTKEVAGWVKGPFGIDYRPILPADDECPAAWAITHIPTGLSVIAVRHNLEKAKEVADQFADLPVDWSSANAADFAGLSAHACGIYSRLIPYAWSGSKTLAPWVYDDPACLPESD